jgi:sulfur-oxidizing protein SoxY
MDETAMIRSGGIGRRGVLAGVSAAGVLQPRWSLADGSAQPDNWPALSAQIFPGRELRDGVAFLTIDAPYRAEDAAVVPIALAMKLPSDDSRQITKLTLVIEANPSPVAGVFTLPPTGGIDRIETRVRVDDYTNIRAVAELSDGELYATARFVKAAGGCSAPALKQANDSIAKGTLRFREFPSATAATGPSRREAQVMIRHPNYSGMQMDQVSRLYIPADFIQTLKVWQGEQPLLTIEAGISISENPAFRFSFMPNGATTFRVEALASDGTRFDGSFPALDDAT